MARAALVLRALLRRAGRWCHHMAARIPVAEVLERQGGRLLCRAAGCLWRLDPERYIHREILRKGVFEPASIRWLRKVARPGMVAFDVGANFGYYTVQLSRWVGSAGKVVAFEPSPGFRSELLEHLELNGCRNVVVEPVGLSDAAERLELFRGLETATFHQQEGIFGEVAAEEVELTTLDTYVEAHAVERLDFVKVDVDGHEERFLAGAEASLRRLRPVMLMEFSQLNLMLAGSGVESLARRLETLDYVLCSERTEKPFKNRWELLVETMNCEHSVNVICLPAEREGVGS